MRVLYTTNYPSPYRVDFFNELGKLCELTVTFEEKPEWQEDRESSWFHTDFKNFKAKYLKPTIKKGQHTLFSLELITEIKKQYDIIIIGMYSTGTAMLAIQYMITHKIPYLIETDGGIAKDGKGFIEKIKTHLIRHARGYFSPSDSSDDYLMTYGAVKSNIYRYPFTSLKEEDFIKAPLSEIEKGELKNELGMNYKMVALGVGQFIPRKGWDLLIRVAHFFPKVGFYIVGGVAPEEYKTLRNAEKAYNVHFIEFKEKQELKKYYYAADFFVLPTREDIWGLVINEALSCALPVVTTTTCVAGIELIKNGKNGYLVTSESEQELKMAIENIVKSLVRNDEMKMEALESIRGYTIENMADVHIRELEKMVH